MKLFFHFLFVKGAGKKKTFFITTAKASSTSKSRKKNPKQCDEQSIPERMRNNDECKIAVLWGSFFLHKI